MKRLFGVSPALAFLVIGMTVHGWADESSLLKQAAEEISRKKNEAGDEIQKLALNNAAKALEAAQEAQSKGDDKQAADMKKKALRWVVQAVRECSEPGDAPGQIADALGEEGAMSANARKRFNDLLEDLVKAKKSKGKSKDPFLQGMALNQIMLALDRLITEGWDGWHPEKALNWYLNAAGACEDVQQLIHDLLDYLNKHADETGIPDLSNEGCAKAKQMLDELYRKKAAKAPPDEIAELVEKIKKFLAEQSRLTGRARAEKDAKRADEEEKRAAGKGAPSQSTALVTAVTFTALEGQTAVSRKFLGAVDTVRFTALDGKEMDPKDAGADFDDHGEHVTVRIGKTARVAGIVLAGAAGTVYILRRGEGGAVRPSGVVPSDGMIEIRNGVIHETLAVPDGAVDILRGPQEHMASIDGQSVSIVALRQGEVAVFGQGIKPSSIGLSTLQITSPSGKVYTGTGSSWGCEITMPEVTKTDVWVPVLARIYGLDPQVQVIFKFLPQSGQQINPLTVTMPAAELMLAKPVAKIRAQRPGPQNLNVSVETKPGS